MCERLHNRRLQHGPGPEHCARFLKGQGLNTIKDRGDFAQPIFRDGVDFLADRPTGFAVVQQVINLSAKLPDQVNQVVRGEGRRLCCAVSLARVDAGAWRFAVSLQAVAKAALAVRVRVRVSGPIVDVGRAHVLSFWSRGWVGFDRNEPPRIAPMRVR